MRMCLTKTSLDSYGSVQGSRSRRRGETDFLANAMPQGHRYLFLPVSASRQPLACGQEKTRLTCSDMSLQVLIPSEAGVAVRAHVRVGVGGRRRRRCHCGRVLVNLHGLGLMRCDRGGGLFVFYSTVPHFSQLLVHSLQNKVSRPAPLWLLGRAGANPTLVYCVYPAASWDGIHPGPHQLRGISQVRRYDGVTTELCRNDWLLSISRCNVDCLQLVNRSLLS